MTFRLVYEFAVFTDGADYGTRALIDIGRINPNVLNHCLVGEDIEARRKKTWMIKRAGSGFFIPADGEVNKTRKRIPPHHKRSVEGNSREWGIETLGCFHALLESFPSFFCIRKRCDIP